MEELDFSDVKKHLEEKKEAKKNRPIEVRKKEVADKAIENAGYLVCLIDG